MSKKRKFIIAALVAIGLVAGGAAVANAAGGTGCATLTYPLCARSVAKTQVVDGSLDGQEVKDGGLTRADIAPADVSAFLKDTNTPDVAGTSSLKAAYNDVTIENAGGSWLTRNTKLGSIQVPAGKWTVHTSVQFQRTEVATPGTVSRPQLAVRLNASPTSFGSSLGTVGGNDISPVVSGDLFGQSESQPWAVSEPTTLTIHAFDYQDNRGSDDSGKIKVVTALIWLTAA